MNLLACAFCFGAEETSLLNGTRLGVLAMILVTAAVQAAFIAFFLYLRKHARQSAEEELDSEWSELQKASRPL